MNTLFIILSFIALISAIILYIFYRKIGNSSFHTACAVAVICAVLFSVCYFLDVGSLFEKEYSTVYTPVTTHHTTSEYQSGRPVRKPSETTTAASEKYDYNGTVYITKSGTKYHYSYTCGGNEYYKCTLEQALERNLSPCKKCAQ